MRFDRRSHTSSPISLSHQLALWICAIFTIAALMVSLNRYWQYESWYYDLGIYQQAIWKVAQFQTPTIDHLVLGGKHVFADHFVPGLFLFSPLFWFTDRSEVLLIAQALMVGMSAYVLFRLSLSTLKNGFFSLAVLISYVLFTGLQNALIFDFHPVTVLTLPLMLTFWAILKGKKKLFVLFFLLSLSFKESLFLLGIGLSIFLFFYRKKWRWLSIFCFFYSIAWGYLSIKVIIPHYSGGWYQYSPQFNGALDFLSQLVTPPLKVKTTFSIMGSFGFLPLLSLATLPTILLNLVARFLSPGTVRWDLGLHYNAEIAPTLAVSTVLAFSFFKKRVSRRVVNFLAVILILNSLFLYRFVFHGPLALSYHPEFYSHTDNFSFLDRLIERVPAEGLVMTQNNLATRFIPQGVVLVREDYQLYSPDYIVLDVREGQNPTNLLGIKDPVSLVERLEADVNFVSIYHRGSQYIFQKTK